MHVNSLKCSLKTNLSNVVVQIFPPGWNGQVQWMVWGEKREMDDELYAPAKHRKPGAEQNDTMSLSRQEEEVIK